MAHIGYWILVVFGFGFLIFVHELGHFIAARSVGIRVLRFALGFGPRLFGKKVGSTDYCLCAFPFGGYVKMAGGEGTDEATGAPDEFPSKTPGQRALVVIAGPFMSVVTAVPILFALLICGMELPTSRINAVLPDVPSSSSRVPSPAWTAGIKRGDLITGLRRAGETDWTQIRYWRDVRFNAALKENVGNIEVRIVRDGQTLVLPLKTTDDGLMGVSWGMVGSGEGYITTKVGLFPSHGAVEHAGIVRDARMISMNGHRVHTWDDVDLTINANPGKSVPVTFALPNGETKTSNVAIASNQFWGMGLTANRPNIVDSVRPDFPAEKAGLRRGDTITAVNGTEVKDWGELERTIVDNAPGLATLTVLRGEKTVSISVQLEQGDTAGDVLGVVPEPNPVIESLSPELTAFLQTSKIATAETLVGAHLIRVKDSTSSREPLKMESLDNIQFIQWAESDQAAASKRLAVTFEREGIEKTIDIPLFKTERGTLDINPKLERVRIVPAGDVIGALGASFRETGNWIHIACKGLWLLVSGQLSMNMLSGPVMILTASRYQAEAGFMKFVEFLVIITVHLGVINLVPFPILDGGHVAFLAIEKVRGKPLTDKVMSALMYAGMAVLIALMIFVTGNDIMKLFDMFRR